MNRFHQVEINKVRKETSDSVSISFNIPQELKNEFTFQAGQYVNLKKVIDGKEVIRSYSIWKSPSENEISVLVKKIENGVFSKYAFNTLTEHESIEVSNPQGNFKLNNEDYSIFFAAGSGITPIISMIKEGLENSTSKKVTLFYGNKTKTDTIFREELNLLKEKYKERFSLHYLFSRENQDNKILNGRIDQMKCIDLISNGFLKLNGGGYYLCGPEEMIFSVKDFLVQQNVEQSKIHFELFVTPTKKENVAEKELDLYEGNVSVKMIIDDDEFEFMYDPSSSESILEAGIENGVDLPFSCKGGVCCTCKAKITKGKAKMRINYALTDDEVEDGYVLTCQSHALTSQLTVDYDG